MRPVFLAAVLVYLLAPAVVVAGASFNARKQLAFPPQGWSLRWYAELLGGSDWLAATGNSLLIAFFSAAAAALIALPTALYCWNRPHWAPRALRVFGLLPFMLPPVIGALGFLVYWSSLGGYGQMWTAILSHGAFLSTLPLVMVGLGLESIHPEVTDAAAMMGANRRRRFFTIVLPLIAPHLAVGAAFAFVVSFNEYIIAFMLVGFVSETLPVKIFNSLRYGYTPVMAAVAVFFIATTALVFALAAKFADLPRLLVGEFKEL